jgi:hypothetical protein
VRTRLPVLKKPNEIVSGALGSPLAIGMEKENILLLQMLLRL